MTAIKATTGSQNITVSINITQNTLTSNGFTDKQQQTSINQTLSLTVCAKPLTITGVSVNNKTYDGSTSATLSNTGQLEGVVSSDNVKLVTTYATATFDNRNVGKNKAVSCSGFTISGTSSSNYNLIQPTNITANITPKELIITGVKINNKIYDATTSATFSNKGSLNGVINGDTVTLINTSTTAIFNNSNVGNNKNVTCSGFELSGTDASKYKLTQPTSNANITPKELTITNIEVNNKTYDGLTTGTLFNSGTLNGIINDDAVSLDSSLAKVTFENAEAGANKNVTVSGLKLIGLGSSNYTLFQPIYANATINKAMPQIVLDPPTLLSRNTNTITLKTIDGQEYSKDNGSTWQDSGEFTKLTENTEYKFISRIKETSNMLASNTSSDLRSLTLAKSVYNLLGGQDVVAEFTDSSTSIKIFFTQESYQEGLTLQVKEAEESQATIGVLDKAIDPSITATSDKMMYYDIKILNEKNNEVLLNGYITVLLPIPDNFDKTEQDLALYWVREDLPDISYDTNDNVVLIDGKYYYCFRTNHFSNWILIDEDLKVPDNEPTEIVVGSEKTNLTGVAAGENNLAAILAIFGIILTGIVNTVTLKTKKLNKKEEKE